MNVRRLLRPHWLLIISLSGSFVAWTLPWGAGVRRGFASPEPLTLFAILFLGTWYGVILLSATLGFAAGREVSPLAWYEQASDRAFYKFFTVLAAVGVTYTYASILSSQPGLLIEALQGRSFNLLRYALPYEAGIYTLRYASVASGSIAIYEIIWKRSRSPVHFVNIVLLMANAAIASRLSLAMAAILVFGIVSQRNPSFRLSLRSIVAAGMLFFLVTTPLNYVRNASFYETHYGITNPLVMNVHEIISYLGVPFQAAVGVANHASANASLPPEDVTEGLASYLVPTYLGVDFSRVAAREQAYREYVEIQPELLTNSAVAHMYSSLGMMAFALIAAVSFGAAFIAGHTSGYSNFVYLASYVLAYAFAELWRIYLFNFGIVHFILLSIAAFPFLGASLGRRSTGRASFPLMASGGHQRRPADRS